MVLNTVIFCLGSLAAFVYQHSLTEISLPCKLILPTKGTTDENYFEKFTLLFLCENLNTPSVTPPAVLLHIPPPLASLLWFVQLSQICHSLFIDLTVGTLKITDRQETETQLLAQGAGKYVTQSRLFAAKHA